MLVSPTLSNFVYIIFICNKSLSYNKTLIKNNILHIRLVLLIIHISIFLLRRCSFGTKELPEVPQRKKFKNNSEKVLTNGYNRVILLPEAKPKCLTEEAMNQYVMIPNSLIQNRELGDKRVVVHNSIFFSGGSAGGIVARVLYAEY